MPSGDSVDAGACVDLGGDADMLLALADDDAGGMPDFATSTYATNRSDRRKRKKEKRKRRILQEKKEKERKKKNPMMCSTRARKNAKIQLKTNCQ